mgnify:CR=1 FL=1
MKPVKNFAKVINLNEGQILVVKETDDESQKPAIRIQSGFEDEDMSVYPLAILGFSDEKERDEAFEKITEVEAQGMLDSFYSILK